MNCTTIRQDEFGTDKTVGGRAIDTFQRELAAEINKITSSSDRSALCAANMLYTWANAGAATQISSVVGTEAQSRLTRMWLLSGSAAGYFNSPETQARAKNISKHNTIVQWLRTIASQVTSEINTARRDKNEDNLQYWRAFSILPVALLSQDPALLSQSKAVFLKAVTDISYMMTPDSRDGFLRLELERGPRALHYHAYAAQPLVGMAVMSQAYKCDFLDSSWKRNKLARLVRKTMEGTYNAQTFTDELAKQGMKNDFKQYMSDDERGDIRNMAYLVNQASPTVYNAVDSYLSSTLKKSSPVLSSTRGEGASEARLGGRYKKMATTVLALKNSKASGLSSVCN